MKIGIFDSGIGGLSVLHRGRQKFPAVDFLYYADQKNVPYGEKTKEEILGFVDEIIRFFIRQEADAVVMACNTATSAAVKEMRDKYDLPILGMEPAVKKAVELHRGKKILVAATPITVRGEKMNLLLEKVDKDHLVDLIALPKLVSFAERGEFDSERVRRYLREMLREYVLEEYSALVLGCTHFNYFKDSFRLLMPKGTGFVDGNEGTLSHLGNRLGISESAESTGGTQYYISGRRLDTERELTFIRGCLSRLDAMMEI